MVHADHVRDLDIVRLRGRLLIDRGLDPRRGFVGPSAAAGRDHGDEGDRQEETSHLTQARRSPQVETPRERGSREATSGGKRLMGFEPTTFCMASSAGGY